MIELILRIIKNKVRKMQQNELDYTEDYLLGGRILLRQPVQGYRVAIDPIFLAASLEVHDGDAVLDIGAGVGAASLCLAVRVPHCRIVGLELQRSSMRLAAENIALNNLRERVEILSGDLLQPPPRLAAGTYAHIMTNPPYLEATRVNAATNAHKQLSNVESSVSLEQWAKFCLLMVRPKGTVTFIHRADRLAEILSYFNGKLGDIVVYPLWPSEGKPAKRVLVRGRKNSHGALTLAPGMILHHSDGKYTPMAEAILRNASPLIMI